MSENKKPYGSADEAIPYANNMYLRDLFAAFALVALASDEKAQWRPSIDEAAKHCYEYADAMLKARDK